MADKNLFFDTGPLITLIMSRLDWILPHLKKQFAGKFFITSAVHRELVERPLEIKRFKFEALQVAKLIREKTLEVYTKVPMQMVNQLEQLANTAFYLQGKSIDIVQSGEMESLAAAEKEKAAGLVMDERTLRLMIENPESMIYLLEHRFKKGITSKPEKVQAFSKAVQGIPVLRSVELISLAFKLGLLESYLESPEKKEELLDAVLWAAKLNGAAVTEEEIETIKKILL